MKKIRSLVSKAFGGEDPSGDGTARCTVLQRERQNNGFFTNENNGFFTNENNGFITTNSHNGSALDDKSKASKACAVVREGCVSGS
jgi:hypothetical protein